MSSTTRGSITGTFGMTMHVHDLGRVTKFWGSLGLDPQQLDADTASLPIPGSGPITLHRWQTACATNGGRPPGTVSGILLAVDDANAMCDRVGAAGGKVVTPPFRPETGGSWAVVADPDGNEFMVCAPK